MSEVPRRDLTTTEQAYAEYVRAPPIDEKFILPEAARTQVFVDVIHDGNWLPEEFLREKDGTAVTFEQIQDDYVRERDWGASAVAHRLVRRLGIPGYTRVNIARVLMDFGRFPGSTPRLADHLHRFAINYPFSELLGYRQKKRLLEVYYDGVSQQLETQLASRLIKVAIHTYDRYNESGTERPATSIMTRSIAYQTESEMPAGLFDPLYPDVLSEFTADRVLRDRISLTLEKKQIPVAHNYPYCLPEGSLEVRYQVWAFFRALQNAYEHTHPDAINDEHHGMVWRMLMDTNLRSSESEALRSYLHMYRTAPEGRREAFQRAADAYESVDRYFRGPGADLLERYRFSPQRTSSIAIEVRKDLVVNMDDKGRPLSMRSDKIDFIADAIAEAVSIYFREDRAWHDLPAQPDLERHTPWYAHPG